MKLTNDWKDYKIIDMANGEKLETWGKYKFLRPDPQIIWTHKSNPSLWNNIDAHYHRNNKGGGYWEYKKNIPESFVISYKDLKFKIGLMGFKHTGLFPEQASNWDYYIEKIKKADRKIKVLNLFAYTGGATIACSYAGADVVHVDSSKGMTNWAKENLELSNLSNNYVRFIVDDVIKFVKREIRRGNKYDAIIMDPPSYGRGNNGEVWYIEKDLYPLLELCENVLSDNPLFVQINSYTTGLSMSVLNNAINLIFTDKYGGKTTFDEIGLPMENSKLILPCGAFARWEKYE